MRSEMSARLFLAPLELVLSLVLRKIKHVVITLDVKLAIINRFKSGTMNKTKNKKLVIEYEVERSTIGDIASTMESSAMS